LRKKYKITFVNKGLRIVVGETKGKGINHLIFRDSYLHLPFALSAWPKLFDLPTKEKGTFPISLHFSNSVDRRASLSHGIPKLLPCSRKCVEDLKR